MSSCSHRQEGRGRNERSQLFLRAHFVFLPPLSCSRHGAEFNMTRVKTLVSQADVGSSCTSILSESWPEELKPGKSELRLYNIQEESLPWSWDVSGWPGRRDRSLVLPGGGGSRCGFTGRVRVCSLHFPEAGVSVI